MKLLLINANTTESITDRLVATARAMAPPGVTIQGATARFGARYVASRAAAAIAEHATLDAFAEHGAEADAVLIACYGDPALDALRELATTPVIGLADACAREASRIGARFGVVSGGAAWKPMLEEFHQRRGYASSLSGIRTIIPTGGDIARDPDAAIASLARTCNDCVTLDGAQSVILGGAGLIGLAARLAPLVPVPVLCSVETGLRAAFAAIGAAPATPDTRHVAVETIGLSAALAGRLG